MKKTYRFNVKGIDCASCARELEEEIGKLDGVSSCTLEFGIVSHLQYDYEGENAEKTEAAMRKIIEDDQDHPEITPVDSLRHEEYIVQGIDCAACAKELEEEIGRLKGVSNCHLDFGIRSRLSYDTEAALASENERKMRRLIEEDQDNPVIEKVSSAREKVYKFRIHNIDCAECAEKLARKTEKIDGVVKCEADFMEETLAVTCDPRQKSRIALEMKQMIAKEEPEVEFSILNEKSHPQEDEEEEESGHMILRLTAGGILFIVSLFLNGVPQAVTALGAYVILGYDVLIKAVRSIGRGQLFDEHFLMAVATIAAIYMKDWKEAAGVMLFYQIGEYFQDLAVEKSRKSIGELMDIRPEFAMVERNGQFEKVDPEEVSSGEIIRVKPGERVPLDGIVTKGASSLDTASLTGESKPRDVDVGDEVISGSVNETGVLEIQVTKEYGDSTVARILDLVENNDSNKATQEKFITKFSRWYTPVVVLAAVITAAVTGVMTGNAHEGIYRACTFLVISCPCALVISIPLSFFAGIGGLSSRGVLVKGANVIETLAKVKNAVMDKTGTLTSGKFAVEEVLDAADKDAVIRDAACAECFSDHPIAEGIRASYGQRIDESRISKVEEIAGRGLKVNVDGRTILAGNSRLMKENSVDFKEEHAAGTLVYVAADGKYEGCLVLLDQLKEDAVQAVNDLHKSGLKVTVVSGDNQAVTDQVGKKIGADKAIGGCLPEDKVEIVREIRNHGLTAFIGDGVNDAPVIANADVGFAMGALGSDAAIEAADVVLMDDAPSKISLAINASERTLRIANENIYFAIIIKIATLILGAFGIANMWMAVFADTGVAMLCVLNSMRLLHIARVPGVNVKKEA